MPVVLTLMNAPLVITSAEQIQTVKTLMAVTYVHVLTDSEKKVPNALTFLNVAMAPLIVKWNAKNCQEPTNVIVRQVMKLTLPTQRHVIKLMNV